MITTISGKLKALLSPALFTVVNMNMLVLVLLLVSGLVLYKNLW